MTTKQPMTDAELENAISTYAQQMEHHMRLYINTNDAKDREKADACRQDMQHAISQRSAARVAEMEAAVDKPGTAPHYFLDKAEEDAKKLPALVRRQAA